MIDLYKFPIVLISVPTNRNLYTFHDRRYFIQMLLKIKKNNFINATVCISIYLRLTNYRNIDRAALATTHVLCGSRNRNINPDMKSQNLRLPQPIWSHRVCATAEHIELETRLLILSFCCCCFFLILSCIVVILVYGTEWSSFRPPSTASLTSHCVLPRCSTKNTLIWSWTLNIKID